ncbi:FMN-binding negative transcriptional regulator [Marixanthomonas ophiurae]|uniref:FMN-binding negative transcriptional regulator n=1 Tax=Marixanthomonas ophiurae TaxID=387659 RepID=A0A3E1Q987_9FLAO|nr:FMN-binding negative transcriptional regulator [Marixanthomonas ophiurae]RFN58688.1 FMN-binding negative transcriptional regulator [Marixanthomonas ophiurae]
MYPPPHHQVDDIDKMIAVIKQYPLGMLVSVKDNKPFLTHIPFIYNAKTGRLVAHIDKNNPQLETLQNGTSVTVVFKGPDCYISPSIYDSEDQLPTWNYIITHVTGNIRLIKNPEAAKQSMIAMTKFLEKSEHKFVLHKDNPKMERFVNYIQAFEIEITNWEGKFKLSQDKSEVDQANAKDTLIKKSGASISGFIKIIYDK